jgi:deoxyhypusine synthase
MVFAEATVALPLIAGYAYHKGNWRDRQPHHLADLFTKSQSKVLAV